MTKAKKLISTLLILFVGALGLAACVVKTPRTIVSLAFQDGSILSEYLVGQELIRENVKVNLTWSTDEVEVLTLDTDGVTFEGFNTDRSGEGTVTFTYQGKSAVANYIVREASFDIDTSVNYTQIDAYSGRLAEAINSTAAKAIQIRMGLPGLTAADIAAINNSDIEYLNLESAIVADNIIPQDAFRGNTKLQVVKLPMDTRVVGTDSFRDMPNLKGVYLNDSLAQITGNPFVGCSSLQRIYISENGENYMTINGVLFTRLGDTLSLIQYPAMREGASYVVPSFVSTISQYAFYENKNLETITLPSSVSRIDDYAFAEAQTVTSIDLKNSGTMLIGKYAFYNCIGLTVMDMPNTVTSIGEGAFMNCTNIGAMTLSTNVSSIETRTFANCENIQTIRLSQSVRDIKAGAFAGAIRLAEIEVAATNTRYSHDDGVLYSRDKTELIYYPEGKLPESGNYSVNDATTTIKEGAFYNTKLTTVGIKAGVKTIESNAFVNNANLISFSAVISDSARFYVDNGILFAKDANFSTTASTLVKYPTARVGENYAIASNVTYISPYAFADSLNLKTITMGDKLTNISSYAFANVPNLERVILTNRIANVQVNAFNGSNNLNSLELNSSSIIFDSGSLNGYTGELKVIAPDSGRVDAAFYGFYDSATGGNAVLDTSAVDGISEKLTASMVSVQSMTIHARYADYETAIDLILKENATEYYYVTNNNEDVNALRENIINAYDIKVTRIDGKVVFDDLTIAMLPAQLQNTSRPSEGKSYIVLITYKHIKYELNIQIKEKVNFVVRYIVDPVDGVGGQVSYTASTGDVQSAQKEITRPAVVEATNDGRYVTAIANAGYQFYGFEVVSGVNKSDYMSLEDFQNNNIQYSIENNRITVQNVLCDVIVKAIFKPLITVSLSNEQTIDSHQHAGGEVYYNGVMVTTVNEFSTIEGGALSLIEAYPYATYPLINYGVNTDNVSGYRFVGWKFLDSDNNLLEIVEEDGKFVIKKGDLVNFVTIKDTLGGSVITTSSVAIENYSFAMQVIAQYVPYFTVTYIAEEGGSLVLNNQGAEMDLLIQTVNYGEDAQPVTVRVDDCYDFNAWSDGYVNQSREDNNITQPATYTVTFTSLIPIEYTSIRTTQDLIDIRQNDPTLTGNYILRNDIDWTASQGTTAWQPLGSKSVPFAGMFDGNGYSISNLNIDGSTMSGMFGYLTGEVRNLTIHNASLSTSIRDEVYSGIIAGYIDNGSISACQVYNSEITVSGSTRAQVGGLAGTVLRGVVSNNIAQVLITVGSNGESYVGGLIGSIYSGEIFNSYSIGELMMTSLSVNSSIGAILGFSNLTVSSNIRNNYYDSTVLDNMQVNSNYTKPTKAVGKTGSGIATPTMNYAKTTVELHSGSAFDEWISEVWSFQAGEYPSINTSSNIIEINSIDDLQKVKNFPSGNFILMTDLDLSSIDNWIPIPFFSGSFDGNNKILRNVSIRGTYESAGFFARVGSGAVIKNMGIDNLYIENSATNSVIGGIAGQQTGGILFGCFVVGSMNAFNATNLTMGGIVGQVSGGGAISNSYAMVNIVSDNSTTTIMGGVVGLIEKATSTPLISNTYSASTIYMKNANGASSLGGLIGENKSRYAIIRDNFYVVNNINAADNIYKKPEALMTGETIGSEVGNIARNSQMFYKDFTNEPLMNWNSKLWNFRAGLNPVLTFAEYFEATSGSGVLGDPFVITTKEQFKWIKLYNYDMYFRLGATIDLSEEDWTPFVFAANLDGNNYSINGLTMNSSKAGGAALFSELNGIIENLNLTNVNVNITSRDSVTFGGIAMDLKSNARIINCAVSGNANILSSGAIVAGGLAGITTGVGEEYFKNNAVYINMNLATTQESTIVAEETDITAGSIMGISGNTSMKNIQAYGQIVVNGRNVDVGGIVGRADSYNSLSMDGIDASLDIKLTGREGAKYRAGGFVGNILGGNIIVRKSIMRSSSIGYVNDNSERATTLIYAGGYVGHLLGDDTSYALSNNSINNQIDLQVRNDESKLGAYIGYDNNNSNRTVNASYAIRNTVETLTSIGTTSNAAYDRMILDQSPIVEQINDGLDAEPDVWGKVETEGYFNGTVVKLKVILAEYVQKIEVGGAYVTQAKSYSLSGIELSSINIEPNATSVEQVDTSTAGIYVINYVYSPLSTRESYCARVFIVVG